MFGFVCSKGCIIIQYYFIIPSLFLMFFFFRFIWNIIVLNNPFFPPLSLCLTSICCVKLRFFPHGLSPTPLCALPHYDRGYTWPFDPESCAGEVIISGRVSQGKLSPFERALWIGQVILYFSVEKSSCLTNFRQSNSHDDHISFTSVSLLEQIW